MLLKKIKFLSSSAKFSQLPVLGLPEYAFVGRSNVGKSSLINMLANSSIAKTSKTPGKTQLINLFEVDCEWVLADLPGYGYARVAKHVSNKWLKLLDEYLTRRDSLACIFLLIDVRLEPQKIDLDFLDFIGTNALPFALIFTKADKLNTSALQTNITNYKKKLLETWEKLPPIFVSSASTYRGSEEIISFIKQTNGYKEP